MLPAIALLGAASFASAAPRTITGTVPNGSVRLAATLDLPESPGPHPVVVALHASGAGERDFASYRHLAQVLPPLGIGVVRFDRRGSGASTGDFERASFRDLASDARAVVRWARANPSVDGRRVALWGMSQGGWIAPLVAAEDPRIAGVVVVSGTAVTPAEQMIYSAQTALREAGYPPEVVERAVRVRRAVDAYYAGKKSRAEVATLLASARSEPWFEMVYLAPELPRDPKSAKWYYQFAFDPAASIAKVRSPVLLLFADRDPWIPVNESITAWQAQARTDPTVHRIPGTNHFMAATTEPAHDADPEPVSEEYTRLMTGWLAHMLGRQPPSRDPRLRHGPVGQLLPAPVGRVRELRFGKEFRYAGGHRFILRNTADAEQHFFVDADEDGEVLRLYWIQFEELLPGMGQDYDYSKDAAVTVGGAPFRRNVRRWDGPPEPDSDRGAMQSFLAKRGYRVPDGAVRVRLVHVPQDNPRAELMIIYAEAPEPGAAAPVAEADVRRRAVEGLRVVTGAGGR